ncbi:hypothetical protein MBGDC06_00220 [Thermoplasmatales archaeon SCGC AB-539-C06]|nr:hypothetical protein MBGDC06_00220 [Thermoplasmatales archaeon SCGC AB-539-C06]
MTYLWFFRDSGISDTNNTRKEIAEIYRMRWDIEPSYRVEKHDFLAKTISKLYKFRIFLFLVAVILYNFWMITRMVYGEKFYAKIEEFNLYHFVFFVTSIN